MNPNQTHKGNRAISAAVRLSLLASVAATGFSYTAMAAAPAAENELEEVTVTGSLLRRTDTETPAPITVITAESMEERGINTVNEALQRLTSNGSGTLNNAWNGGGGNFASGGSAPSLRGLTVQATLTVFDGQRMAVYPFADDGHRNFVDLNTIPTAAIDRIEVLKDGASSTYGADAIAGVVNIITKKEITGFHADVSGGRATTADAGNEGRFEGSWGMGHLDSDGYNFYVAGEYLHTDPIMAKSLAYPYNTVNLNNVCDSAGHCGKNNSYLGISQGLDGNGVPYSVLSGSTTGYVPTVRPYANANGTGALGTYQLLNTTVGCNLYPGQTPVQLTAQQIADSGLTGTLKPGQLYCGADPRNLFGQLQGEEQRAGALSRFTIKIGDNAEFFASGAYTNSQSQSHFPFSNPMANVTTDPGAVTLSPVMLPVYVCSAGVGTIVNNVNISSGCNATNGTLNPNNPFASQGQYARLLWRWDGPRTADTVAESMRGAMGLTGSFGDGWNYTADATYSKVKIELDEDGNQIPQRIADVIATGAFNFVNPAANSDAIRQYVAPTSITNSNSELWQIQATISKSLMELAGGPLQAALGAAYRDESLFWESANPANVAAPYNRYYGVNAVGAQGSRNVVSPFFEIDAPFTKQIEVNVSGRYDDYSSGQSNFSPKVGVKYKPIEQLALRGTYSQGFRIPSFNEAFGLPTTGFTSDQVDCAVHAAFCASHGNNSYATDPYNLGETVAGNPSLNSEKSNSYTLGLVYAPKSNISMTLDYWNIEVKDLISKLSGDDRQAAKDQYYANNGVVNLPGITVTKGVPDALFPNALPLINSITSSFQNSDSQVASGIDLGVNTSWQLPHDVTWSSDLQASYLLEYTVTRKSGSVEKYAGTLSPCDYTSCSGSPTWRANWSNTLSWQKFSLTGTLYFTSGVNQAEVDYGGDPSDCASNNGGDGSPYYYKTSIPVQCHSKDIWNFDLNARYKVNDNLTVYMDALNVLGIKAPYDSAAAYAASYFYPNYNPAFATQNAIGRFIRIGVKADF